jgi:hypothetical protein
MNNNIERSQSYKNNLIKIGNETNNIKIINKFISEDDCKKFINFTKNIDGSVAPTQFDDKMNPISWNTSFKIKNINEFDKYKIIVKSIVEKEYEIKIKNKSFGSIVRWDVGSKMAMHSDDIYTLRNDGTGITEKHHMSGLIYLNDSYDGGEIYFSKQNLLIKPKTGDLLIFPGNINYPHEVKVITSGSRYTVPLWFEFD